MQHKHDESFTNGLSGSCCQLRLLTCICFCGWDVWVAGANAFSRGPRALSLPSELIIYSIYKTLYVQNRKICKGSQNKKKEWVTNSSETDIYTPSSVMKLLQQRLHFECTEGNYFMLECVSWGQLLTLIAQSLTLQEAVRLEAGPLTEQLGWKSRSGKEIDQVSSYKQYRAQSVKQNKQCRTYALAPASAFQHAQTTPGEKWPTFQCFSQPYFVPVCRVDMVPYVNQTFWINLENSH